MAKSTLVQQDIGYHEAQAFIEERGIRPGQDGYTTSQLGGELSRRGWRWEFNPEWAQATKAYPPSPGDDQTIIAETPSAIGSLVLVLARAILFDEDHGLSPVCSFRADIIARAPDGTMAAVIEVRNRKDLTPELATTLRQNLLGLGLGVLRSQSFMLVSQEVGYLWDHRKVLQLNAPPTLTFSMRTVIERYASWLEVGERLGGAQLELIVAAWLNGLAATHTEPPQPLATELSASGFLDVIRDARILVETEA